MPEKETMKFDAEVEKLFHLVIHSLYENKDIFLRELISNASDACDKLRYKALDKPALLGDDLELKISITPDADAKTITIRDNGIGMTRSEIVKNLGTIARSGTQGFLDKLTGDKKHDTQLIGQFGVGFYSAFMVAKKIQVISRAAGKKQAVKWESDGKKGFSVEETDALDGRGTQITLFLNDESDEYLDQHRISHIIKTYSNHVAFDIEFIDKTGSATKLNDGSAIWTKQKSELKDEDYLEFYQSISHMGMDEPWLTMHNKAEGAIEYTNLLYIPSKKPFDLFHPDRQTQVKLYIKRVFVAEEKIDVIPQYLRFLRGIVDSEDLPLNISRETIQNNVVVQKIKRSITKKVLSELAKKRKKSQEDYNLFWENFGPVLKEGLCDAMEPREDLLKACQFRTSISGEQSITMEEYVSRMKDGQQSIFYITGDDVDTLMDSPQLEGFRSRGLEVLLLTDSVDDFWVNVVNDYNGTNLVSITRSNQAVEEELDKFQSENDKKDSEKSSDLPDEAELTTFFKDVLGDAVKEVKTSSRLTDSPVCLSVPDGYMNIRMERFMVENKQMPEGSAHILEVNPKHPIIKKLADDIAAGEKSQNEDVVHLLFAQASIIEGEPVSDINAFTKRMNELLKKTLAA